VNPTKAAAIIALVVTIAAGIYLGYEVVVVQPEYQSQEARFYDCQIKREATLRNWQNVEDQATLYRAQGQDRKAEAFEKKHAGERPVFIGECSDIFDVEKPAYAVPLAILVVGLITSLALFGAAKKSAT
jgi:hypothetical protein